MTSPTGHDTGRIVPLRGGDPAALVERVLAERTAGRVPLIGDDRWSEPYWAAVCERVAAAGPQPGQAWATLTSGSTGDPRIVLRTADSWAASFAAITELLGTEPGDVLALSSPPASSLSLFSIAHAADAGLTLALPSGHALTAEDARQATLFHGTPTGLRTLLDAGAPAGLRTALIGGASLDPSLRARARAQGIRVIAYYGAAELSFVAVDDGVLDGSAVDDGALDGSADSDSADDDRADSDRADSAHTGLRAFPGVDLEVRDDDVLWVRSPFIASGYLPGSAAVPSAGPLRRDGEWATVGDRARLQAGRLTLLGRADDAILTAAATVIPTDVEAALRRLDEVADAVVFGLPNEGVGELVSAVIEAAPGTDPTRARLRTASAALLPPSHQPRRWFLVDELPRTITGKPARAELIARVRAGEVDAL